MRFELHLDPRTSILEVIYPEAPTSLEIGDYVARLRRFIDERQGSWLALVDQRQLKVMSPELMDALKVMNGYAQARGMKRIARLVPDALGSLSAWRVSKEAALKIPAQTFTDREEALRWLLS